MISQSTTRNLVSTDKDVLCNYVFAAMFDCVLKNVCENLDIFVNKI